MLLRRRGSNWANDRAGGSDREPAAPEPDSGIASELAFHIDWILHAFDPDSPSTPEPCSTASPENPDDIAEVSLLERRFACISFRGRIVAETSPEKTLKIWREQQPEPVSDERFEQVCSHIRAYLDYEQARLRQPQDPAKDPPGLDPDGETRAHSVAVRLVRLAMRAENADGPTRRAIFARIRRVIAEHPVSIEAATGDAGAHPVFQCTAHQQRRARLIRKRAATGAQLTPEARARLTIRILLLDEEIRQLQV